MIPDSSSRPDPGVVRLEKAWPWLGRGLGRPMASLMEGLLDLGRFNRWISECGPEGPAEGVFRRALDSLPFGVEVERGSIDLVPAEGAVVVVANHPHGGADTLALGALLTERRSDLRILANSVVTGVSALSPWLIPVDILSGRGEAAVRNHRAMRQALGHLRQGGCLLVFPGGAVSALRWTSPRVEDPPWTRHVSALVRRGRATVVPVGIPGRNSWLFQAAGLAHPLLRTAMLPREFLRWKGKTVRVRIGRPVSAARWAGLPGADGLVAHLRMRVDMLRRFSSEVDEPPGLGELRRWLPRRRSGPDPGMQPVAEAVDPELLEAEVGALRAADCLAERSGLQVWLATPSRVPGLMRELGRLREVTFRGVGEGTGKALDLDRYDEDYEQLILWNPDKREVAGGYRLGRSDVLAARHGRRGLYTYTLFRFSDAFLKRLGPALELGRSFVAPTYQRKPHALFLLWRGIGAFVGRHPRYRMLFGPVSISNAYRGVSRNLMVQFLRQHHADRGLGALVDARHPYRTAGYFHRHRQQLAESLRSIEDVSAVVADLEEDGKGVPVLLRQYVRLNAVLLKFNIDPAFHDALDGLMVVDLLHSDPAVVGRYLGEEGLRRLAGCHGHAAISPPEVA